MECRPLDVTVISAKGLKNVNIMSKMDVYAIVSIAGGDPRMTQRTTTDKDAGTHPKWKFPMKFTLDEAAAQSNRLALVFTIISERMLGDKVVGEVHVPVKELLDGGNKTGNKTVSYGVRRPNGKTKGELEFSYVFGEKYSYGAAAPPPPAVSEVKGAAEPVVAYPPPSASAAAATATASSSTAYAAYPPPGYAQPPPTYGYPQQYPPQYPQQYPVPGYGYPPAQMQHPPKKSGGSKLGMGLAGGLLGGLLLGEMIDDVGDAAAYEAGYDAGLDDGYGF